VAAVRLTDAQIGAMFTLLGITAFSTVVPWPAGSPAVTPLEVGQAIARATW